MFIKQMNHKLLPLYNPLNNSNLPFIVVKYVDPVPHTKTLAPIHLPSNFIKTSRFKLVSGPFVPKPHFNHKDITIFDDEFFQSHLKLFIN